MNVARAFQPEICPLQLAACGLQLRGGGAGCWSHAKTRRREGKSRGGCLVFEQGLRQMPDGTHGRCQGCLSRVMTWNRLLVGGLAFRTEAAALNDHSLSMVHQSIDHGSGLRFANFRPQPPLFLSSGGLPAANLLQTLRGLTIALVTSTRRVNTLHNPCSDKHAAEIWIFESGALNLCYADRIPREVSPVSKLSSCFRRGWNFEALSPAVQPQSRLH